MPATMYSAPLQHPANLFPSRSLPTLLLAFVLLGLSSVALRADVTAYGLFRGEEYHQDGTAAPGAQDLDTHGVLGSAVVDGDYFLAMVPAPGEFGLPLILMPEADGSPWWSAYMPFLNAATRDSTFPSGSHSFQFLGFSGSDLATLTLGEVSLPPIPSLTGHNPVIKVDPAQSHTLAWLPFNGAGPDDVLRVVVSVDGEVVFSTPPPGHLGALAGTTSQVILPAGVLPDAEFFEGTLTFFKVTSKGPGNLPGSTALSGSFRQTHFFQALAENGDPSGGPTLVSVLPAIGALNVPADTTVQFTFSAAMMPVADILWLQNNLPLADNQFEYAWSNGNRTLTARYLPGFAPGAFVTWALRDGFEDLEGNPLDTQGAGGIFIVASGGTGGCDEDPLAPPGGFSVSKYHRFQQIGPDALVPAAEDPHLFSANFIPTTGLVVGAASITPPGQSALPLSSFFGSSYFHFASFESAAALDAAFPPGTYSARVEPVGMAAITMTVDAFGPQPPTPRLVNHAAAQAIDPTAQFNLTWSPFTGASDDSVIVVSVMDANGDEVFSAPDFCEAIELPVSATSITLPAGTLAPGQTYTLELGFFRFHALTEHGPSGLSLRSSQGVQTETTLRTLGGPPAGDLVFSDPGIGTNGRFQVTLQAPPGAQVVFEVLAGSLWTPLGTHPVPPGGSLQIEDPAPLAGHRIYRARTLP